MTFLKSKLSLLGAPFLLVGGMAVAGVGSPRLAEGGDANADSTKVSPQETLVRSKQMSAQMASAENRISGLLKRAEAKKDMVMVNCVSDKLTQLRGYAAVGNSAAAGIDQAIQRNNEGERAHNLDRQTIVYQKVLILGTEAEGCVGEDVSYVGATRVEVDIDPSIPTEDPTIPKVLPPTDYRPPEGECPDT